LQPGICPEFRYSAALNGRSGSTISNLIRLLPLPSLSVFVTRMWPTSPVLRTCVPPSSLFVEAEDVDDPHSRNVGWNEVYLGADHVTYQPFGGVLAQGLAGDGADADARSVLALGGVVAVVLHCAFCSPQYVGVAVAMLTTCEFTAEG
jgi:hypothetical protein